MSQARAFKLREYHTDILSHELAYTPNNQSMSQTQKIRLTDIIKPQALLQEIKEITGKVNGREHVKPAVLMHATSRERLYRGERPFAAKVQRTSYQDSNIFGYKVPQDITVQFTAKKEEAQPKVRNNNNFNSRVFETVDASNDFHFINEADRSPSTTRNEAKWQSNVFGDPIQEQVKRKKLGRKDHGIDSFYGKDKLEYTSSNVMAAKSSVKKNDNFSKAFVPVRSQKTAQQRKNEEVYGKSTLNSYQTGKRLDGSLMADTADWRNPQQTYTNSPTKFSQTQRYGTAKDRKFENLESNVVLGDAEEKQKLQYDPNVTKSTFGTDAGWSHQATSAKINNTYGKVDTFKKRQEQLSSTQVFHSVDYTPYQTSTKKSTDINNLYDSIKKGDHNFSDALPNGAIEVVGPEAYDGSVSKGIKPNPDLVHATRRWAEPDVKNQIKKNYESYNGTDAKYNELKSVLDTYDPEIVHQNGHSATKSSTYEYAQPTIVCQTPSKVTKIRDLASNLLNQESALDKYSSVKDPSSANTQVYELVVSGLPADAHAEDIRGIAQAKHIVDAVVEQDTIKNVCTGVGKLKIRLSDGEDLDQIKNQFIQAGLDVQDLKVNPNKKPNFTYKQALLERSPPKTTVDSKVSKMHNLTSTHPETFGTTGTFQSQFVDNFDPLELSQSKKTTLIEKLAMQTWSKVSQGTAVANGKKGGSSQQQSRRTTRK